MQKKIILDIVPQTWVRATQNDRKLFILYNLHRAGKYVMSKSGMARVERLEQYNEYKVALLALAKQQKFMLPEQGASIVFYIPVSKSWKKHKKESMHMQLHRNKPDLSNLLKSFEDGLMTEDKGIANYTGLTKMWINGPGRIEIIIDAPVLASKDVLA